MSATFVLSTGRCGTQWLAKTLGDSLPPDWRVVHEPIHLAYAPKINTPAEPLRYNRDLLMDHLMSIQKHIADGGHYVECGFPCWRHLAWFRDELECNVNVIHLHRDPASTARSWLKQNAFVPPLLPHLPTKELFHPAAPGAMLIEYEAEWPDLTPFEKNLYYWAEVQRQALAYKSEWNKECWFNLPFTCLGGTDLLARLGEFLRGRPLPLTGTIQKVDQYPGMAQAAVDESLLHRHPQVQECARLLGY